MGISHYGNFAQIDGPSSYKEHPLKAVGIGITKCGAAAHPPFPSGPLRGAAALACVYFLNRFFTAANSGSKFSLAPSS